MGAKNIISRSSDIFSSRDDAAKRLAAHLMRFRVDHPVVLGIPRGGVVIAEVIALALDGDLDVVLSHKLGAPANPELAIGAVCEDGSVFVDEELALHTGANKDYIGQEKPSKLILALPVGPKDTVIYLSMDADETVCLKTPLSFRAIGCFYINFEQLQENELLEILQHAGGKMCKN